MDFFIVSTTLMPTISEELTGMPPSLLSIPALALMVDTSSISRDVYCFIRFFFAHVSYKHVYIFRVIFSSFFLIRNEFQEDPIPCNGEKESDPYLGLEKAVSEVCKI